MGEETTKQDGNTQSQSNQSQSTENPLLNRPLNPKLQIIVQKGSDKPLERTQEGQIERKQDGGRITEQRKEEDKTIKE
jgi:hypothetical protein